MNYTELKQKTNRGWNTWNIFNALSYTHLPEGFTINLCFKDYGDKQVYRQNYWRGRIWALTNFLAYSAMKYAGLKKECGDLAQKFEELLLKEWRLHGHIHENYNGDTGMGCDVHNSAPFYHWGGLLAYMAIDHEG